MPHSAGKAFHHKVNDCDKAQLAQRPLTFGVGGPCQQKEHRWVVIASMPRVN